MIPDYLTFIRFQDKRNLLFIYIVTFVLLGFYWKNAGFSFTRQDVWLASAIFALILYSFTADLKAFWAYKCVVKNVDLSIFLKKEARPTAPIVYDPLVAMVIATLVFAGISALMLTLAQPDIVLLTLTIVAPLIIWGMFAAMRTIYIRQVIASTRDKGKYKRLSQYLAIAITLSIVMNLLTISPLRNSEQFERYGRYFTLESIIPCWCFVRWCWQSIFCFYGSRSDISFWGTFSLTRSISFSLRRSPGGLCLRNRCG